MSTVTTRPLSNDERHDIVAIRGNLNDLVGSDGRGKIGFYTIAVTAWSWTNGGSAFAADAGKVRLCPPNFNKQCEDALIDDVALTNTQGSVGSLTWKYVVAVNNGVPGPSAQINPDGSVDLLWLHYDLTKGTTLTNQTVTVTYTVTYTDLTPSTMDNSGSTVDLTVFDDNFTDGFVISSAASSLSGHTGRALVTLNSLINNSGDMPYMHQQGGELLKPWKMGDDGVPMFIVSSISRKLMFQHPVAKRSGKTIYGTHSAFCFAINNGKVDMNGLNAKRSEGNGVLFAHAILTKVAEMPCDDYVDVTLNYTYNYTDA